MTSLVQIIHTLTLASARMPAELPRGLHLVHYPPDGRQPARLVAARHIATPSAAELRIVRDALLAALDRHESRVLTVIGDWTEANKGDWNGYQISYEMQSVTDAFGPDRDKLRRIRLALEERERRTLKPRKNRTQKSRPPTPAADPGPKPML